jgi:hypothetical protein
MPAEAKPKPEEAEIPPSPQPEQSKITSESVAVKPKVRGETVEEKINRYARLECSMHAHKKAEIESILLNLAIS